YIDFPNSPAFALVDHQLAHIYLQPTNSEPWASARAALPNVAATVGRVIDPTLSTATVRERSSQSNLPQRVTDLFRNLPGISVVHKGPDRAKIGLDHQRSGDIILISEDTRWFAYYWWLDDRAAPPFARTVDIHQKPGYDPAELFFDPATKGIPLNASLVKGSHGHPAISSRHRTALIPSTPTKAIQSDMTYRDTDLPRLILSILGLQE
ncbi:MAG: hypothetical protein AABZ47_07590, partial [Planctomycetota bacterium]